MEELGLAFLVPVFKKLKICNGGDLYYHLILNYILFLRGAKLIFNLFFSRQFNAIRRPNPQNIFLFEFVPATKSSTRINKHVPDSTKRLGASGDELKIDGFEAEFRTGNFLGQLEDEERHEDGRD